MVDANGRTPLHVAAAYDKEKAVALMVELVEDLDIGDLSYNPWYPGGAIAMYQPLYDESVEYEDGTPATLDQMSYDVANFLTWAAEPTMEERKRLGFIVMGFLIIFVILMYLSVSKLFRLSTIGGMT